MNPLLNDISHCDGLILGSPVYFGDISGQMRSFFERLVFPYFTYLEKVDSLAPRKFPVATIYDMNVPQDSPLVEYYETVFDAFEQYLHGVFSKGKRLTVYDTYQFRDYSKYANDVFDADLKRESLEKPALLSDLSPLPSSPLLHAAQETRSTADNASAIIFKNRFIFSSTFLCFTSIRWKQYCPIGFIISLSRPVVNPKSEM